MKTIEQIADYLACQQVLNDEQMDWLRQRGFLQATWEFEDYYDDDDNWEIECERREQEFAELLPGELDLIEQDFLIQADQIKAKLPPRSSKGARRKRGLRKSLGSAGKQTNRSNRAKRMHVRIKNQSGVCEEMIFSLLEALRMDQKYVVIAAASMLKKFEHEKIADSTGVGSKILHPLLHFDREVNLAGIDLLFSFPPGKKSAPTAQTLIEHLNNHSLLESLQSNKLFFSFGKIVFECCNLPASEYKQNCFRWYHQQSFKFKLDSIGQLKRALRERCNYRYGSLVDSAISQARKIRRKTYRYFTYRFNLGTRLQRTMRLVLDYEVESVIDSLFGDSRNTQRKKRREDIGVLIEVMKALKLMKDAPA